MNALNREEMASLVTRWILAPFDLASGTRQARLPKGDDPANGGGSVCARYRMPLIGLG